MAITILLDTLIYFRLVPSTEEKKYRICYYRESGIPLISNSIAKKNNDTVKLQINSHCRRLLNANY